MQINTKTGKLTLTARERKVLADGQEVAANIAKHSHCESTSSVAKTVADASEELAKLLNGEPGEVQS